MLSNGSDSSGHDNGSDHDDVESVGNILIICTRAIHRGRPTSLKKMITFPREPVIHNLIIDS